MINFENPNLNEQTPENNKTSPLKKALSPVTKILFAAALYGAGYEARTVQENHEQKEKNPISMMKEMDYWEHDVDTGLDQDSLDKYSKQIGLPIIAEQLDSDPKNIIYKVNTGEKEFKLNEHQINDFIESVREGNRIFKNSLLREYRMKELGINEADLGKLSDEQVDSLYTLKWDKKVLTDELEKLEDTVYAEVK